MTFRKKILYTIIIQIFFYLLITLPGKAQAQNKLTLDGYLKFMNTNMFQDVGNPWYIENMLHNRLNINYYATDHFTAGMGIRNRFIYGDLVQNYPGYKSMVEADMGYLNALTGNLIEDTSYVFTSSIDRLWLEYVYGNLNVKLGRQRINWGQTMAWNPNDIFNTYSFFDFDYEERPGSDALRVQYYTGYTALAEAAIKIDSAENITAAGLYRFNKWGYDIQFLGGMLNSSDWLAGTGWSGNIWDMGFSGEISYFRPKKHFEDTSGYFMTSLSLNYMFTNALMIQAEYLYNEFAGTMNIADFTQYYVMPLSVKTVSFSKHSWFANISYPFHPLLNGTFSGMYFYDDNIKGFFVGPSLEYSLQNNLSTSLYGQWFDLDMGKTEQTFTFLFLRFRWSF